MQFTLPCIHCGRALLWSKNNGNLYMNRQIFIYCCKTQFHDYIALAKSEVKIHFTFCSQCYTVTWNRAGVRDTRLFTFITIAISIWMNVICFKCCLQSAKQKEERKLKFIPKPILITIKPTFAVVVSGSGGL